MARPKKEKVDYFPHMVRHGRTLKIMESGWGIGGYAFWFKLLELLGDTEGHAYHAASDEFWMYLVAHCGASEEQSREMLDTLARLGAIDRDLWAHRIVWSQNFVDGLKPLYDRRGRPLPQKPGVFEPETPHEPVPSDVFEPETGVFEPETPQRRGEESKEKKNPPQPPPAGEVPSGAGKDVLNKTQRARFERFRALWPKGRWKNPGRAERAWKKLNPDEQLTDLILEGLRRAVVSKEWAKDGGDYVPHPATWLNGRGWEGEYSPAGTDQDGRPTLSDADYREHKRQYNLATDWLEKYRARKMQLQEGLPVLPENGGRQAALEKLDADTRQKFVELAEAEKLFDDCDREVRRLAKILGIGQEVTA